MQAEEYVRNGEVIGDNFDEYAEHMFGEYELVGVKNAESHYGNDNKVAILRSSEGMTVYRPFTSVEVAN